MDDASTLCAPPPRATAARPLIGTTILLVEDSRFASEAMRLLCLRSGARLRRADCLASARRHLAVYRPTVAIVDLGLPDGEGSELIEEMAIASPRVPVILGTSGDLSGEETAVAAGADGYLPKPISRIATFQEAVLRHLPADVQPMGPRQLPEDSVHPDELALRDDLEHARTLLRDDRERTSQTYIAQFLGSLSRSVGDAALTRAADAFAQDAGIAARDSLLALLQDRLKDRSPI